jgi:hypothetical protein
MLIKRNILNLKITVSSSSGLFFVNSINLGRNKKEKETKISFFLRGKQVREIL